MVWIVIGVAALAAAAWAFWPRRRGIVDGDVRGLKRRGQGKVENYNNPSGPNFNGRF
ncbi:hypothetical protein [Nocardioides sp.]|uniref:hypothetical protein n=1 Tax=Nocardioides sp. TaxID=35761 RepID=UPI002ED9C276